MEDTAWLAALVAQAQATVARVVQQVAAAGRTQDLGTLERAVQAGLRQVGQVVVEAMVAAQAQQVVATPGGCGQCGGRLRAVGLRPRTLVGLVGAYRLRRPYYVCRTCQTPSTPLDGRLGLGSTGLSPGLARLAAYEGSRHSFAEAALALAEHHGVQVDAETVRSVTERLGQVAEADQRDRTCYACPDEAVPALLLVTLDGVLVPHCTGWQEAKLGRLAPLGPTARWDPVTQRPMLPLGPSTYCVGLEPAEAFWPRVAREAWRRGLGRGVRTVVLLGDGAEWLWLAGRTHLALRGVQVVEILDFYHAVQHLATAAQAVFGHAPLRAQTWLAAVRHRLRHQGPLPVLAALGRLRSPHAAAADEVRKVIAYVTTHAARMAYPTFAAQGWPLGSGAIESACKSVVQQRQAQAGMRWGVPGSQQVASLRALHCSGRWAAFWQTQPLYRSRLLADAGAATQPAPAVPPAATRTHPVIPRGTAPAATAHVQTAGKAWWPSRSWQTRLVCPKRSA
jgi:hypothetical protein